MQKLITDKKQLEVLKEIRKDINLVKSFTSTYLSRGWNKDVVSAFFVEELESGLFQMFTVSGAVGKIVKSKNKALSELAGKPYQINSCNAKQAVIESLDAEEAMDFYGRIVPRLLDNVKTSPAVFELDIEIDSHKVEGLRYCDAVLKIARNIEEGKKFNVEALKLLPDGEYKVKHVNHTSNTLLIYNEDLEVVLPIIV